MRCSNRKHFSRLFVQQVFFELPSLGETGPEPVSCIYYFLWGSGITLQEILDQAEDTTDSKGARENVVPTG